MASVEHSESDSSVGRMDMQTKLEIVVKIVVEIGRKLESKLL